MSEEKKKRHMVRVETDETGLMKAVTFEGKVLPVHAFTAEANARDPFITIHLEVEPAEFHTTTQIGQISLRCPICEENHVHECFDGRVDDADGYTDDPKY